MYIYIYIYIYICVCNVGISDLFVGKYQKQGKIRVIFVIICQQCVI